jgi:hypothetical protein
MWAQVDDPVVGSERGPFCVGVMARELVVFRGLDVYSDGGQISDVPCTWMVGTDVGFICMHPESRRECGFAKDGKGKWSRTVAR